MVRMIKWMAPAVAAFGLMLGAAAVHAADGGTVTGSVVDKDGKAAAGIEIRITKPMARPEGGARGAAPKPDAKAEGDKPAAPGGDKPAAGGGRGGNRPAPVATGKTGDDGKYKIEGVPAGEYVVIAGGAGKGFARSEKITVEAGKTVEVKELKLAERPAGGRGGAGGAGAPPAK